MTSRGPLLLAIVLGLAFLAQLAAQAWMRTPAYDEAVYRGISRNILRTGLPYRDTAPREPFVNSPPIALYANAGLMALTGDHLPATRLLSAVLWGTLLLALVLAISRRCLGRGHGGLVIAGLCLMPLLGPEILHVEVDLPLIVSVTALVLAWIVWAERFSAGSRAGSALLVGLLLALAGLVKYSALMLGPLLAIDAFVLALRRHVALTRAIRDVVLFAAPPVLLLIGWGLLLAAVGDADLLATFEDLFTRIRGKEGASARVSLLWYAKVTALGLNGFLLLLAGAGSVLAILGRRDPAYGARMRVLLAATLHVGFFALISAAERKVRYQDPALPFLAILAALPLRHVTWRFRSEAALILLGTVAAVAIHAYRPSISSPADWSPLPIALAAGALGAWIVVAVVRAERGSTSPALFLPVLVLALTQAVLMNSLVKGSRLEGYDVGRRLGLVVAQETPPDAEIAGVNPVVVYHADRPTHLMTLGRDYRARLESGLAALILTDEWIENQPESAKVREILANRYRLRERDAAGVSLYFASGR